jgi:molybdopterin/thiamine biosynthesis adenylyltransferase
MPEEVSCASMGVFAPLVGIVGSLQASEAIQVLLGDSKLVGQLLMIQAQGSEFHRMGIKRNPNCPVCSLPAHSAA